MDLREFRFKISEILLPGKVPLSSSCLYSREQKVLAVDESGRYRELGRKVTPNGEPSVDLLWTMAVILSHHLRCRYSS